LALTFVLDLNIWCLPSLTKKLIILQKVDSPLTPIITDYYKLNVKLRLSSMEILVFGKI